MSEKIDQMRAYIVAAPLEDARTIVLRQIKIAARSRVYAYALDARITDFNDTVLVEQAHRDFRANTIDLAQNKVSDAQSAADINELIAVFDSISSFLE